MTFEEVHKQIEKYENEIRADAIRKFVEWLDENYEVEIIKPKVFYKGGSQHRIEINPHDLTETYLKDLMKGVTK